MLRRGFIILLNGLKNITKGDSFVISNKFESGDSSNIVNVANGCDLSGSIRGKNNFIEIGDLTHAKINLNINGDDNVVAISGKGYIRGISINIGNNVRANKTELRIGSNFSNEGGGEILLFNSGNKCIIGNNCMFSKNIKIRCGESPHLIFCKSTGDYLDISSGVFIGDHVWVGEDVYITKNVSIPAESMVGARSVVTKRFDETNIVLAGNPAKIVRRDIQWIRNPSLLKEGSNYHESYTKLINSYI